MSVSQNMRFKIFERDGFTCQYCGKKAPQAVLEIDHIHPISAGGSDNMDNLLAACEECNRGKGKSLIGRAEHTSSVKKRVMKLHEKYLLRKKLSQTEDAILYMANDSRWKLIGYWEEKRGKERNENGNWETSRTVANAIGGLLAKYSFDEVFRCIEITLSRHWDSNDMTAIKYLYGVVRNRENLINDGGA